MPVGGKDCRIARRTIQVLIVFMVLLASLMVVTMRVQAQEPQPTPTADRLAQPTLPATPSQADLGAVEYWFACMVCHGDRGQGLTEEWRAASGPDDMNCWQSRCHASNHPPEGFKLPLYAPMVIGEGAIVGGGAGVTKNVAPGAFVSGYPAAPHSKATRIHAHVMRLPELRERVADLEKRLARLEGRTH